MLFKAFLKFKPNVFFKNFPNSLQLLDIYSLTRKWIKVEKINMVEEAVCRVTGGRFL